VLACPLEATISAKMFLRPHQRSKDGKDHTYWSLVETVRTAQWSSSENTCVIWVS
jgi:hypothetical protein